MSNFLTTNPEWNKVSKLLLNQYETACKGDLIKEDKMNGSKLLILKDRLMMKPRTLLI